MILIISRRYVHKTKDFGNIVEDAELCGEVKLM